MRLIEILLLIGMAVIIILQVASWLRQRANTNVVSKVVDKLPNQQAIESINKLKVFSHFEEIAIISDLSGNIQYVSEAISKSLGWLPEDIIGKNALILIPSQFHKSYQIGMKNLNEISVSHFLDKVLNVCLLNEDGKEVPVEVIIRMRNDDGHSYLVGMIKDMYNYNAKVKSLQWMIDFYRDCMGIIDAGCFDADILKDLVTMDDNMLRIFDLPPDIRTFPTGVTTDRIFSDDRDAVAAAVAKAVYEGLGYEVEFNTVANKKIKLVAQTVLGEDGKVNNIRGACRILR